MAVIDREACLELRARYLRLIMALQHTRNHNPETLEAVEQVLQPQRISAPVVQLLVPMRQIKTPVVRERHAA